MDAIVGSMPPDRQMMYKFALDCAEHKIYNNCDKNCNNCASNIGMYNLSHQDAVMLQHAAEMETQHRFQLQHEQRMRNLKEVKMQKQANVFTVITVFVFIVLSIMLTMWIFRMIMPKPEPQQSANHNEIHAVNIFRTLLRIYPVDMNGDGKITCIDYAIEFYNIYPLQDSVQIVVNHNYARNWHHLFVYVDGVAVEPSAALAPGKDGNIYVNMESFWGDVYNPKYDTDVTAYWDLIKYNKYQW
ncbi:MAG: hypothetical protein LBL64_02065 [Treponema sp.]|jgi:hypothetical protein|nr:hypothetical protein [Treponema sp.]